MYMICMLNKYTGNVINIKEFPDEENAIRFCGQRNIDENFFYFISAFK